MMMMIHLLGVLVPFNALLLNIYIYIYKIHDRLMGEMLIKSFFLKKKKGKGFLMESRFSLNAKEASR